MRAMGSWCSMNYVILVILSNVKRHGIESLLFIPGINITLRINLDDI